jgi:hypothetical protein
MDGEQQLRGTPTGYAQKKPDEQIIAIDTATHFFHDDFPFRDTEGPGDEGIVAGGEQIIIRGKPVSRIIAPVTETVTGRHVHGRAGKGIGKKYDRTD